MRTYELERRLRPAVYAMEQTGVAVHTDQLEGLIEESTEKANALKEELAEERGIDPGSSKQLIEKFELKGRTGWPQTNGGSPKTDKEAMKRLLAEEPSDYEVVEGKQHDDALEGLVGEHVLQYLYAEFDDGKEVLLKAPKDMWEEVKMRVPLDSHRWFPSSSNRFGRDLNRLKQALAYKGFDIGRGTTGTGNAKRNVIKVARIDDVGSMRVDGGSTKSGSIDPAENGVGMPESPRREGVWVDGSTKPLTSSGRKKKKYGRNSKRRAKSIDPVDPAQPKPGESGVDKPKNPGSTNRDFIDPLSTQNGGSSTQNGLVTTDEGVQEALRKLKGDK